MKLKITHLKAPWPLGARVGDVLDLPFVPPWAKGKCVHVGDDVEPTVEFEQPEPVRDLEAELTKALADLADSSTELEKANLLIIQAGERNQELLVELEAELIKSEGLAAKVAKLEAAAVLSSTTLGSGTGEASPSAEDVAKTGKAKK